ncbi:MAG: double-CXXCG motif protein [bacterium]
MKRVCQVKNISLYKNFWKIEPPDYESDYKDIFVNGSGKHLFGLPGVKCSTCGETWGGSRILPFECPSSFQKLKEIRDRWPISSEEHLKLRQSLLKELNKSGQNIDFLLPGDEFQPVYLEFPSRPKSDFLWSTLGSIIVSQKVKSLFKSNNVSGITFCPAIIKKVGKRESVGPVPIPETGEPEDIIKEVEKEKSPNKFGPLFEMVVISNSGKPPGVEVTKQCKSCGREEFDESKRVLILTKDIIPETDIFFLNTTLYIIVNDKVRDIILQNHFTNINFLEMEVE